MRALKKDEQLAALDCLDCLRVFGLIKGLDPIYSAVKTNNPTAIKSSCQKLFWDQSLSSHDEWKPLFDLWTKIFNAISDDSKTPFFPSTTEPRKISLAESGLVTVTMTTCKRFDLFSRTMDSFLNCCEDVGQHVKEWIVIDDNSSSEDRQRMKEMWPFITLVAKEKADKGHPRSMNMILKMVTTPYILHLEDDWEFFASGPWIGYLLKILKSNDSYGQALFNLGYAEDNHIGATIQGAKFEANPVSHFVHRHLQPHEIAKESKFFPCNCFYWPHFSLRPGLWKMESVKSVGSFDESADHFEKEFAIRYNQKGLKTAFLPLIVCNHTGRRTYETKTKQNAYDLNNEQQFSKKSSPPQPPKKVQGSDQLHIDTFVINLKRRPDRLLDFVKKNNHDIPSFKVFEGVDGKSIQNSFLVHKLFETGDYDFRRGIVGCALSHIGVWKNLVKDPGSDWALVFEDDAVLAPNFMPRFLHLLNTYKADADLMFLHWLPYPGFKNLDDFVWTKTPTAKRWSKDECIAKSMGGATAYVINRKAAMHLLKHVDSHGVYNAIDWVMFKCADEIRIMYSTPMLAFAECVQSNGGVNSDIQRDFSTCGIPDIDDFEIKWWKSRGIEPVNLIEADGSEENLQKFVCCISSVKNELPRDKQWIWYKGKKAIFTVPWRLADGEFLSTHPLFDHRLFLSA